MSEQEPSQDPEFSSTDYASLYKEAHPNAVDDAQKAEAMAHAGDDYESIRVRIERDAQRHEAQTQGPFADDHRRAAEGRRSMAEIARANADEEEAAAGEEFDKAKKSQ